MTRRTSERFERRKKDIVASAVQALNRKGVRGMTLADVAAQLGIVPTGVIYYFKNKEELAEACFLLAVARYEGFVEQALGAETARERIAAFNRAYFDFRHAVALGEAEHVAVFNDVRALNREAVNVAYVAMFRRIRSLFDGAGAEALTRLERNARTHLLLSEAFWEVVWLSKLEPEDYERAADRTQSLLLDGLMAGGARWDPLPLPDLISEDEADAGELFLRAATQLINEEGYLGASVDKISARLNLTKGAFYYHHETKDELVVACFERTFQIMRRAIRQAERVSANGLQALMTAAAALVECQLSGTSPLLRTSALTTAPVSIQPQLHAKFDGVSDRFAALLSDGIADGSVRPVDVNITAQMLTAMINAAAELHFWTPGLERGQEVDLYVRPFFEGLLTPGAV
ncbi:AcrR family transcriptional regulator [Phenylobacterium haematophilum]|uniref:AcrR family transcriptional regulator n=1 Tax=Phenylobacterium haematophilum TaxID=98513 RepID=A0A840A5V6_9CAUL|nr:TetR/AcrR family transcriptional regulator [Phenylobacterium haematophilum]MBB3893369.1 AcrR family transcriptional regulator [Phenylobacterium haematophilum]